MSERLDTDLLILAMIRARYDHGATRRLIHIDAADFWLKERMGIKDRQGVLS
jgi:hypothetical protein